MIQIQQPQPQPQDAQAQAQAQALCQRQTADAHSAELRLGGISRFSTADWPGRLAAVLFIQGCPWRCGYCHNPDLQLRDAKGAQQPACAEVLAWLPSRRGLLDGVVFSGGEPLLDAALPDAMKRVKFLGFAIGLHTAGIYPERLAAVLPQLDWVGLDIKAALDDAGSYHRITRSPAAWRDAQRSLSLVQAAHETHGLDYECRTTWHPSLFHSDELLRLSHQLRNAGAQRWVLQMARATANWKPVGEGPALPDKLKQQLLSDWPALEIRVGS